MTRIETDTADLTTIEPLADEIAAAQAATRDGGLPPLGAADRIALHAAHRLLTWTRHHREHADHAAQHAETLHDDSTFSHRVDAGLPR
jgi:hypothetical protein